MPLDDAHNHLQDARFGGRQAELVAEAARAGVGRMVVNGSCEEDWPAVLELAQRFPQVVPSFGYHPWYLHERTPLWREQLIRHLDAIPSAIGEIGLDRWKEGLDDSLQEEMFRTQLTLAAERDIPASIHCLKAWGWMVDVLESNPLPSRGFLLHSYGGSADLVPRLAKLGAYFGFPGYFLHERKARQREVFRVVPRDRLLIETDAPDQCLPESLDEHPLRDSAGNRLNHPANLGVIHRELARVLELEPTELEAQLKANFERLFGQAPETKAD